ncbi:hypothetical protein L596_014191 [Steinernema carpocapsae]|uniref:Uncharacterized protein n=1 Tax=Steinernema carpocapsae TaxID=34508 RepID=A0A4U5NB27_STECR|nr:hypothetical protein L596_014191 [Steinernema carpocapsae]
MRELLAHAVVTLGTGRFFVTVGGDEAADVEEEFEEAASTSFLAVESGEFVIATAARSLRLRIRRLRLLKGNRDALCVELGDAPQNRQAGRGPDHSPTTFSRNPPRTNGTASGNSGAQGVHGTPIRRGSMGGTPNASGPGRYGSPSGSSIRSPGFSNQPLNLSTKKPPDDPKEDKKPKQKNSKEEKKPSNSTAAGKSEVKLIPDNPFFSQALLNSMKSTVPKMKKFAQNVAKKPLGLLKAKESANVICVPSVTSPTAIVAAMQKKAKEEEAAKVKEAEKQRKKSDAQKIDELFCQPSTSKSTPPHRKPERKNSTERLRESDKAMAEPVDPKQHLEKTKASPLERESSRDKNKWLSFPDKPRKEEAAAAKETEEREAPESTKVPNGAPGEELIGISPCSSYTSQLDLSPADVSMMEEIRKIERSVDDTVDWNDFNYNISRPSSAINVRSVKYEEVRVPDDDLYRLDSDEEGGEENVEEEEEARKDEGKEDDNNAAGIPVTPVQSPEGEDSRSPASSKNESSLLSPTGSIPTSSEAQKGQFL